jgi:Protein of unknown function (DUF1194)
MVQLLILRWLMRYVLSAAFYLLLTIASPLQAQTVVDVELVLAVDISYSMDLDEQRLQREGYVAALLDAEVHKAIAAGPNGRIAVTYFEWAGQFVQKLIVPWTLIDGPESANRFVEELQKTPPSRDRMTSITGAMEYSAKQFEQSPFRGVRRVIDVSGDGPNNSGGLVTTIRDRLVEGGVVINGLPIMVKVSGINNQFDLANLDEYFVDCVIGGPGAFMIPIKAKEEFLPATRRKLLMEIAGYEAPARLIRVQARAEAPQVDCTIGERMADRWRNSWPRN